MIHFECDYTEGAHPSVIEKLCSTNLEQTNGYGNDPYCEKARSVIRQLAEMPDADVHFLVGGTQTNRTVISSILRPHQGVIAASTGHIAVHETGAIEASGHKVLTIPSTDGKITASGIKDLVMAHYSDNDHEHCVQPGMVYISFPTETGTLYSKRELQELSSLCCELGLPLYIDGARLGYGLMADGNDLTLPEMARHCDVFTIGGTKGGALFGEAVVFTNSTLSRDFRYLIKQNGGMLAKGRLLGVQFLALLESGIYFDIARHADRLAMKIKNALSDMGIKFHCPCTTNQQFVYLPIGLIQRLSDKYSFSIAPCDKEGYRTVRICTSWATKEETVNELISDIATYYPSSQSNHHETID